MSYAELAPHVSDSRYRLTYDCQGFMSINGHFREISPRLLQRIQEDPSLTRTIILGSMQKMPGAEAAATAHFERLQAPYPTRENEALAAALDHLSPMQKKMALFAVTKIRDLYGTAHTQLGDLSGIEAGSLGAHLSVGKAWHGLHFLFAGSVGPNSTPVGQAILGGVEIGEDTGYGSPRYLEVNATADIANALGQLREQEVRSRYDANAMNDADLYPSDWGEPENLEWLMQEFDRVRQFYSGVAERQNAVLLYHI